MYRAGAGGTVSKGGGAHLSNGGEMRSTAYCALSYGEGGLGQVKGWLPMQPPTILTQQIQHASILYIHICMCVSLGPDKARYR